MTTDSTGNKPTRRDLIGRAAAGTTAGIAIRLLPGALLSSTFISGALAQKKYGPGVTDTEIMLGQTAPYSGPGSAYSLIAKAEAAYFTFINESGGVNGRKINLVSLDDGLSPPRTFEQTRKLVEQEKVLAIFSTIGTATNVVIKKYLNEKKVPQLFASTGLSSFGDPTNFPWTIAFVPTLRSEGKLYAEYAMANVKEPKIGILYQNDDFGKDCLRGFKDTLGDKAKSLVVSENSYELTDATVDSQVISMKGAGANVFMNITESEVCSTGDPQGVRHRLEAAAANGKRCRNGRVDAQACGIEQSTGIISAQYMKDPTDPRWKDDPGVKDFLTFMAKYMPQTDISDVWCVQGYTYAQNLVHVLKQCGDDLTRENLMRQATNLKDVELPLLLPGLKVNTSPTNFFPIDHAILVKFDGTGWQFIS